LFSLSGFTYITIKEISLAEEVTEIYIICHSFWRKKDNENYMHSTKPVSVKTANILQFYVTSRSAKTASYFIPTKRKK
jgi:hypothetical protein